MSSSRCALIVMAQRREPSSIASRRQPYRLPAAAMLFNRDCMVLI